MNNLDPEIEFPKVEKMLYKLAWKCSEKYAIPFEETKSETYVAFMTAVRRYDPDRPGASSFSTLCYICAKWRLKTMVMERAGEPVTLEIKEDMVGCAGPERSPSLEMIDDLSADAKEIIALILETPAEILGMQPVPIKALVNRIKDYLIWSCGRNHHRVEAAHQEIKQRFQTEWALA